LIQACDNSGLDINTSVTPVSDTWDPEIHVDARADARGDVGAAFTLARLGTAAKLPEALVPLLAHQAAVDARPTTRLVSLRQWPEADGAVARLHAWSIGAADDFGAHHFCNSRAYVSGAAGGMRGFDSPSRIKSGNRVCDGAPVSPRTTDNATRRVPRRAWDCSTRHCDCISEP